MPKFNSKIFIDGGDPAETTEAVKMLGFLDGQTTNPTLIAKNLSAKLGGKKISEIEALNEYKRIVCEMNKIIPKGSISIQVFANEKTLSGDMLEQARERNKWIPNASIKLPCTYEGLKAASQACREFPINITLVFSQNQAAAAYEATRSARFPVFISPFIGRLDDRGENGMQIIANILKMYRFGDGHVEVLTASVRNIEQILYALNIGANIITIPFKIFKEWGDAGFRTPYTNYIYHKPELADIPYQENIALGRHWTEYDIKHDLTAAGVVMFWQDWNSLLL